MPYYTGWLIPEHERDRLLAIFNPVYQKVYAHHVTCEYDVPEDAPLPTIKRGKLIGYATDRESIEALVFSINGTQLRPDGKTYHCTWSLDKDKKNAVDSNDLIKENGYLNFLHPMMIDIEPQLFFS